MEQDVSGFDEMRDESSCRHQETEALDDCKGNKAAESDHDSIASVITLVNGYTVTHGC